MPLATNPQTGEAVYLTPDGQWSPAQTAVNPTTKEMLAFDGKEWKPLPAPSKGVMGYVDDAVRSVASGLTFGYADELAAKMDELTGRGGSYADNVARERARDKQIPAAIGIPGEIAGAVGGAVAAAPVTAAGAALTGISRLPQAARYIAGGAGGGALFGSGSAEEDGRLTGAAQGAGVGAVAGAVAPKVMSVLDNIAYGVRNAFSPRTNAAADIGRAINRDGTTPQAVAQQLREAQAFRPDATLADVGGENVRGLVERVAQTPGAGRTIVVPALTERQQGQMNRLAGDLQQLTGTRQTATQAIEQTMSQRSQSARPLYDGAFNFNARAVPEIAQAWEQATNTGFGRAFMAKPEFRRTLQTEYGINNPADAPLMVQIDVWKKVADDFIRENIGTNKARVAQAMRDRVVGIVDEFNPAYLSARNAWAGPSRYMDAIDEGRNILQTRISADELRAGVQAMSEVEREAFRIGAVSAIRAKMGSDPARMADMTKYLRAPEVRAKIAAIMPDDAARAAWEQRLGYEIESSALAGRSLGNSATYRRGAEREDADKIVIDLVSDVFKGNTNTTTLFDFIFNQARRVGRAARDTLRSRTDQIEADILTQPQSSQALDQLLNQIGAATRGPNPLRNPAVTNAANAAVQ
jgi:hypothetical protein